MYEKWLSPQVLLQEGNRIAFVGRVVFEGEDLISRGCALAALLMMARKWLNSQAVVADGDALNLYISTRCELKQLVGAMRELSGYLTKHPNLVVRCFLAPSSTSVRQEAYQFGSLKFEKPTLFLLHPAFVAAVRVAQLGELEPPNDQDQYAPHVEMYWVGHVQYDKSSSSGGETSRQRTAGQVVDKHSDTYWYRPWRKHPGVQRCDVDGSDKKETLESLFSIQSLTEQEPAAQSERWMLVKLDKNNASGWMQKPNENTTDSQNPDPHQKLIRTTTETVSALLKGVPKLWLVERHEEAAYFLLPKDKLSTLQTFISQQSLKQIPEDSPEVNLAEYKMIAYSIPEPIVLKDGDESIVHVILPVDHTKEARLEQQAKRTGKLVIDDGSDRPAYGELRHNTPVPQPRNLTVYNNPLRDGQPPATSPGGNNSSPILRANSPENLADVLLQHCLYHKKVCIEGHKVDLRLVVPTAPYTNHSLMIVASWIGDQPNQELGNATQIIPAQLFWTHSPEARRAWLQFQAEVLQRVSDQLPKGWQMFFIENAFPYVSEFNPAKEKVPKSLMLPHGHVVILTAKEYEAMHRKPEENTPLPIGSKLQELSKDAQESTLAKLFESLLLDHLSKLTLEVLRGGCERIFGATGGSGAEYPRIVMHPKEFEHYQSVHLPSIQFPMSWLHAEEGSPNEQAWGGVERLLFEVMIKLSNHSGVMPHSIVEAISSILYATQNPELFTLFSPSMVSALEKRYRVPQMSPATVLYSRIVPANKDSSEPVLEIALSPLGLSGMKLLGMERRGYGIQRTSPAGSDPRGSDVPQDTGFEQVEASRLHFFKLIQEACSVSWQREHRSGNRVKTE